MDRTRRGGGVGEGANLSLGDAHGERRGRATSSVGLTVSHSDEAPSGILPRMALSSEGRSVVDLVDLAESGTD